MAINIELLGISEEEDEAWWYSNDYDTTAFGNFTIGRDDMKTKEEVARDIYKYKTNKESVSHFYRALYELINMASPNYRTRIGFGFTNEVNVFEEWKVSISKGEEYAFFTKYGVLK